MSDNTLRFEATAGTALAAADSSVILQDLPAENPGIRIEEGSKGHIRFGAKCTANSFDVDCKLASKRVYKIPKGAKFFTTCGGPVYFTLGSAEWVS